MYSLQFTSSSGSSPAFVRAVLRVPSGVPINDTFVTLGEYARAWVQCERV
jgi:hypothetical protein